MKSLNRNKLLLAVSFLLFMFFLISSSFAQDKNQAADKKSNIDVLVVKLQQKILLNNDQVTQLKEILSKLEANPTKENLTSTQKTVEAMLDMRQKAKFEIVKNEWWNEVKQKFNISN